MIHAGRALGCGSRSAEAFLADVFGVSPALRAKFFEPFFRGVALAPLAEQDARCFLLTFRALAAGATSLPADGIGAVSTQLADALPATATIRLGTRVEAVHDRGDDVVVTLPGGEEAFDRVVVAVDGPAAARLLPGVKAPAARSSTCVYFSLDAADLPTREPTLVLQPGATTAATPVNNVCFPANTQPTYAPPGRALCSATVLDGLLDERIDDDEALVAAVRNNLERLFPEARVPEWTYERLYRIPFAQPAQRIGAPLEAAPSYSDAVFLAGDHLTDPSLNGAMESGTRAGRAVLESLGLG